jgi:type II restriction enzyme
LGIVNRKNKIEDKNVKINIVKIELKDSIKSYTKILLKNYKPTDEVVKITELSSDDWLRKVYNNIYPELLEEIGEKDNPYIKFLRLPEQIVESSVDSANWGKFEDILVDAYNIFDDIDAEKKSGPGEPDIICRYDKRVFVSDAKSTKKKLSVLHTTRINKHIKDYKAEFSIIVAPSYNSGVITTDLFGQNICLITSYCFSDLINRYAFIKVENKEECLFKDIYEIIIKNLGSDISEKVYEYVNENLGSE